MKLDGDKLLADYNVAFNNMKAQLDESLADQDYREAAEAVVCMEIINLFIDGVKSGDYTIKD